MIPKALEFQGVYDFSQNGQRWVHLMRISSCSKYKYTKRLCLPRTQWCLQKSFRLGVLPLSPCLVEHLDSGEDSNMHFQWRKKEERMERREAIRDGGMEWGGESYWNPLIRMQRSPEWPSFLKLSPYPLGLSFFGKAPLRSQFTFHTSGFLIGNKLQVGTHITSPSTGTTRPDLDASEVGPAHSLRASRKSPGGVWVQDQRDSEGDC